MVGSVVRAINSGLGNLCWEFYRHGLIDKAIIIDDLKHDQIFFDRYKCPKTISKIPIPKDDMEWLLKDIDTLLIFETPYEWSLLDKARKRGIKIVFMPMHEFPPKDIADVWLCPSDLEMELPVTGKKIRINVPVDRDRIVWRERERAISFIHNAGGGGILGRNGTNELINSLKHTDSDFDLTIRSQVNKYSVNDSRVTVLHENVKNYWDLYRYGDVFILPDKFAGLSLPLQEAYASGMLVVTTNRHPLNTWLPKDVLIEPESIATAGNFDMAIIDPVNIAEAIDKVYNMDIREYSRKGKEWGDNNSWEKLLPKYKKILYERN